MKITAAVARSGVPGFTVEALSLDAPRDTEVMVRIAGVGLCHTDVVVRETSEAWYPFPAVLGHEGAGIVEAVGSEVWSVKQGDVVVLSFASCGACRPCRTASPAHCDAMLALNFRGRRPDGSTALHDAAGPVSSHFFGQSSFASHVIADASNVVRVDDDLPLDLLGPLGCGIQTGAGAVFHSLERATEIACSY